MGKQEKLPLEGVAPELRNGLVHHAAGRPFDAGQCYQGPLQHDATNAEALLLLGILARQTRQADAAIRLTTLAAGLRPDRARFRLQVALSYLAAGDGKAARQQCQTA